jgi:hypothetical protein
MQEKRTEMNIFLHKNLGGNVYFPQNSFLKF